MCFATTCQPTTLLVRTNDKISSRIFLVVVALLGAIACEMWMVVQFCLRNGINNKDDRWSEHGLGHLLHPPDPESEDHDWIAKTWLRVIRQALGLPIENLIDWLSDG